jgi:hypothetical protein
MTTTTRTEDMTGAEIAAASAAAAADFDPPDFKQLLHGVRWGATLGDLNKAPIYAYDVRELHKMPVPIPLPRGRSTVFKVVLDGKPALLLCGSPFAGVVNVGIARQDTLGDWRVDPVAVQWFYENDEIRLLGANGMALERDHDAADDIERYTVLLARIRELTTRARDKLLPRLLRQPVDEG